MGNYRIITNRIMANKAGEQKGRLRVRVPNGSEIAEGDYLCPECGNQGKVNQAFEANYRQVREMRLLHEDAQAQGQEEIYYGFSTLSNWFKPSFF